MATTTTAQEAVDVKKEISELKIFFNGIDLASKTPIALNKGEKIINSKRFLDSHFSFVESNLNNKLYEPYLERLRLLKTKIENENKI